MTVIFCDTETTGTDPRIHNVWEVALIEETGEVYQAIVNPDLIDLETADPTALRMTHYYERSQQWRGERLRIDKAERMNPATIALEVAQRTAGKHLVGAVVSFDATFLTKLLLQNGLTPAWHYHVVDVEAMAAGRLGLTPPWDSDEINERLGLADRDFGPKHTALADAWWARAVYEETLTPTGRLVGA